VLVAAAVPIVWMVIVSLGRTGAVARDMPDSETVRRPAGNPAPHAPMPDVRLALSRPPQPATEPLLRRDPFAFAPRILPPAPPSPPISIVPPPDLPPATPPSVALSLIGVATSSRTDGRAERTAIIAGDAGALYMVRDGDAVTTRYRVDAVLEDSARLIDVATGASMHLIIR
jgi:hypothetical protein